MELTSDEFEERERRESGGRLDFEEITIEKGIALLIAAATAIFIGVELLTASGLL